MRPRAILVATTLAALGAVGAALRQFSRSTPDLPIDQLPGMVLFAPLSMVAIWIGWRTVWRKRELLTLAVVLILTFAQWNAIMLWGLPWSAVPSALGINAIHWGLFLIAGGTAASLLQSLSGVAIRSSDEPRTHSPVRPMQLSLRQVCLLAILSCAAAVFYKSQVLDRPDYLFRSAWYQLFPSDQRTIISGAIGGALVPVCWLAVWASLRMKTWRMASWVLLIPLFAILRAGAGGLYWDTPVYAIGTDALQSDLRMQSYESIWMKLSIPTAPAQPNWKAWIAEAAMQLVLILLSQQWLRSANYELTRPPLPCPETTSIPS
jgi:hypothetical protein